jgi:hypothetical protein
MVTLEEEDPDLVEFMVIFFYTLRYPEPFHFDYSAKCFDYTSNVEAIAKFEENTITHAKVYAMAEQYDVPGFKEAAASALDSILKVIGKTTEDTPDAPVRFPSPMSFITELLAVAYETTPPQDRGLRDVICNFIKFNKTELLGRKGVQDYARNNSSFGTDLLNLQLNAWMAESTLWCPECAM